MNHVRMAVVVIAFMTSTVALAQEDSAPETADLKLSKTLTLNPSGTAPTVVSPVPSAPESAAPSVREPVQGAPDSSKPSTVSWKTLLALLALPAVYWLGRRKQSALVATTEAANKSMNEQVSTLKNALLVLGAGPRTEWQSTLTSLQTQLRDKSSYIDQMHDQRTANAAQLDQFEKALQEQTEATTNLKQEHKKALEERVGDIQTKLDDEIKAGTQNLKQQALVSQQNLDKQTSEAELRINALESQSEKISAELDTVKASLKDSEAALESSRKDFTNATSELENASVELNSKTDHINQLTSEIASLQSSNDASVEELKKYVSDNAELEQKVARALSDKEHSQTLLDQEKLDGQERLANGQLEFAANLEAEKRAQTEQTSQQAEEFARTVEQLEHTIKERDEALEAAMREASEELLNAQRKSSSDWETEERKLKQEAEQQATEFARKITELEQAIDDKQTELETQQREAEQHLAGEKAKFAANLEAEKSALTQSAEQQSEQLQTTVAELEQSIEERDAKLKMLEADFAHASDSADSALQDRDRDLAVLVQKLASHESTAQALDEINQAHEGALEQLQARTEEVAELEEAVLKSIEHLERLETAETELAKKDAELAQIQSITVDTEHALNEARAALAEQTQILEEKAQANETQQIEELTRKLAEVTAQSEDDAKQAREASEARQALEDKLLHQEQDTALLLDSLKALESEHQRQNLMVNNLESSVEQLEADLSEREEENTHTLKQLALAADQSAALEAEIENNDVLDSHIQELEAQLVSEQQLRNETTSTQKFLVEKSDFRSAELEQEVKALKLSVDNQTQTNEHLKKTLEQARKYREELEENTRDLERENRELSKASTKSREELQVSSQAMQENVHKISERDRTIQELENALDSKTKELTASKTELGSLFDRVDELTASVALMESSTEDDSTNDLSDKLDRTRRELNQNTQLLSSAKAARDEHERNATALQEQLAKVQEKLEQKQDRTKTLGTQLIELSEQRDHNLKTIASLQEALDAVPPAVTADHSATSTQTPGAPIVPPGEEIEEAMRARENIISALEHELHTADIKIAGLNQKLEDYQMAARAETRVDDPDDRTPVSSEEIERLNVALMEKTRLIQALSNDVKVNKDLVRVFENDSNMLHDVEVKLESLEEHSHFLEHELAKAVTENKTLKSEIEKAAKSLARHRNIGRTVSEDTRLEQLRSKLNLLESENRQHLEVIAELRESHRRTS